MHSSLIRNKLEMYEIQHLVKNRDHRDSGHKVRHLKKIREKQVLKLFNRFFCLTLKGKD